MFIKVKIKYGFETFIFGLVTYFSYKRTLECCKSVFLRNKINSIESQFTYLQGVVAGFLERRQT